MDAARASVAASLTLIVVVSLLSGPLVGLDLTTAPASAVGSGVGQGTLTATVTSMPDNATLERGGFGADAFALSAPPATIDIESVSGQPLVVYRLEIPELGLTHSTTYFVSSTDRGTLTLEMDPYSLSPDRITADSYRGTVAVSVRIGERVNHLDRHNVTVEVVR
ncbi:MAG: hypothetical protein ACOCR0_02005 [Haloferacaceae archaeon]